jgi:hypothetical protein
MPGFLSGRTRTFYILFSAGATFIIIGIASAVYTNIPVDVRLSGSIKPGTTDNLTPNMNIGNSANIVITGSKFNVTITDPDRHIIKAERGNSIFNYNLVAEKEGQYTITTKNTGNSDLTLNGHAQTKGSVTALTGQMMLIVTGIIVTGLGLRLRNK